ncbi:anthranilate O-methyltransferase 3-like [Triticum dicoccoides]|uniref:anthranilate O-methyltransferase 3-like n=1 Tax=Triticum dicoccoides TaxID=85692 RepID=UPI00188ECF7E|nr:anthranilate O-methyltransferase 3-like [Triticum dicoccoides]
MASKQMVHMNQGQGERSYVLGNAQQNRMKLLIEGAIIDLYSRTSTLLPEMMVIADLGCSFGPNSLSLVLVAVEAIHGYCLQFQQAPPELCVFLNDLPDNDFNTVVKSLVTLRRINDPVVVTGVAPGSFYERLFTSSSVHLVCSSSSLHWLSKVSEVLRRNQIPAYYINDHARREKLPMVLEAYAQQLRKDFRHFLELRAKELVTGGQMVVSIIGRHSDGIAPFHIWDILAQVLSIMASEGVIDKAKFDSFYVPVYGPSKDDLREIIQEEGSFSIKEFLVHDFLIDLDSALVTPSWIANQIRAVHEQIVVQHFGDVMDEFVRITERHWSLDTSLMQEEHVGLAMLTLSVTKA